MKKMKSLRRKARFSIFITLAIMLLALLASEPSSGVTPGSDSLINRTNPPVNTLAETGTGEKTPGTSPIMTLSIVPYSSLTYTPTPTIPTFTQIPTITLTPIPVPTLNKEKANQVVRELLKNNGGCILPCWFGVTPGVTPWTEARKIFESFSTIDDSGDLETRVKGNLRHIASHGIGFKIPGEEREWGALLIEQDGIIVFIHVDAITAKRSGFVLSKLLSDYGKPNQIKIWTTIHVPGNELPFRLVLYYEELHIFVDYRLEGRKVDESICIDPKNEGPILFLWANDSQYEVFNGEFPDWWFFSGEKPPIKIDQVTDLTLDSFYQKFKDPKASESLCSEINKWP
jgi:hypothetical protein